MITKFEQFLKENLVLKPQINKSKETGFLSVQTQIESPQNWNILSHEIYDRILDFDPGLFDDLDRDSSQDNYEQFKYKILSIPVEHRQGLIEYHDDIIDYYNSMDIWIKDTYKNNDGTWKFIDVIDYDSGEIYIITKSH